MALMPVSATYNELTKSTTACLSALARTLQFTPYLFNLANLERICDIMKDHVESRDYFWPHIEKHLPKPFAGRPVDEMIEHDLLPFLLDKTLCLKSANFEW